MAVASPSGLMLCISKLCCNSSLVLTILHIAVAQARLLDIRNVAVPSGNQALHCLHYVLV